MTPLKEILSARTGLAREGDDALIARAYEFAKAAHEGTTRYSGEPYFIHPAAVAKVLAEYGMDATTIAAGLLHDAVEDGRTSATEIEKAFGTDVAFLVEGVTKLGRQKYRGAERHAESLRRLLVATAEDVRVLIIKLADRYHNMGTLEHVPEEKRHRIALETIEIYCPIADRLGMGRMRRELEDLAFPYVDSAAYSETLELQRAATKESAAGLVKVRRALQRELAKKGLKDFRTEIRIKGLWSLYQKLARKDGDIAQIYDIAALRIIVKDDADCYKALGIVHALYKPIPGKFKDYVAFPRPSGYQSLHTAVLTPEAGIVEVQIRSEQMHRTAAFGIASSVAYKLLERSAPRSSFAALSFSWVRGLIPSLMRVGRRAEPAAESGAVEIVAPPWLAELAEAHAGVAESKEFIEGLKEDFFSHRVFIFTPKGDVIDLPTGATAVDFAYAVHSDLGDHLAGAKVNGKLVSFDTPLANGAVVEVLRRESAHPSAKWLEAAKTSLARRRIRSALGATEPDKPMRARKARASRHGKRP